MKRRLRLVLLIWLFIILPHPKNTNAEQNKFENKLLLDTLITILNPYISEEIEQYYGYPKSYGLYDTKIIDIARKEE